jgi:Domain of unknown function (DUF5658)
VRGEAHAAVDGRGGGLTWERSLLARWGSSPDRMVLLLPCGLLVLNVCDVLPTLQGIDMGRLREANVLVHMALNRSVPMAVAAKVVLVCGGSLVLWRWRDRRLVYWSVVGLTACYGALVYYETLIMTRL